MPKLSIIIPVYNIDEYIGSALDSVRMRVEDDWECVCVDDGSTDGSAAILDKYATNDSRIKVFHKSNGGVSSARNLALEKASGDWVTFLDGDDRLEMTTVFESIALAEQRQADFVTFGKTYWNEFDCRVSEDPAEICRMQGMCVWGGVYKKNLLDGLYFNERISHNEDMAFFSAVLARNPKMISYNKLGYKITERPGSASRGTLKAKVFLGRLRAADEVAKNFVEAPSLDRACRRYYLGILLRENFGDLRIGGVIGVAEEGPVYYDEVRRILPHLLATFSGELTLPAKLMLKFAARYPILITSKTRAWIILFKVLMKAGWLVK